eukprot:gnl/TRDRNA2_/TRDRNA2_47711_c0_seq1.p1 gnl/TRDRNA2_/TRDRNA2_47711_c0~~gnl/TRDRNA2_/TRDRNA2_47711_c0_seq1.p1  ORF type:complete len:100 (-),score=24.34 gnl/TRDRNA2_/TRDRNA2_47711_c0_seq1:489-788(-)
MTDATTTEKEEVNSLTAEGGDDASGKRRPSKTLKEKLFGAKDEDEPAPKEERRPSKIECALIDPMRENTAPLQEGHENAAKPIDAASGVKRTSFRQGSK